MIEPEDLPPMSREELLALVAELQRQIAALTASHEALRAELEQLKRSEKRPAAPFSKGIRATAPKRPGRQPGEGPFRSRATPPPEAITESPVDVQVTLDGCPTCGGLLAEERVDFVSTTELLQQPRPKVTQYRVWVCRCTVGGTQVRGQHPAIAPAPGVALRGREPRA
jgi:transposase